MITDTHAHLYYPEIISNIEEILSRAKDAGIERIIVPAVDLETSEIVLNMSEKYEMIFCALGIHPGEVNKAQTFMIDNLADMLNHEKVVAVGETGLDYYWDKTFMEKQKSFFRLQIELAKSYRLPVVIHTRDSVEDAINMIKENYDENLSGQFHCFSGNQSQLEEVMKLENFYVSYCGNITYKNFSETGTVAMTPPEKLLSETDSPFLPPVPFRGKKNEPSYITYTLKKISEINKTGMEDLLNKINKNINLLFFRKKEIQE